MDKPLLEKEERKEERREETREERREEGLSTASLAGVGQGTASSGTSGAAAAPGREAGEEEAIALFTQNDARELQDQWDSVQAGFVDEPRRAVEQADKLVAATMKRMAEMFARERAKLEGQWDRGDNISTEDLRVALRRYRSFFKRLLSI
jgi:hypothetical protein